MAIALAFLMRYWRDTLIGVLLIGLLLAWHSHNVALVERGKALERLRVSDSTIVVLQNQKARIDTVYRRDTMRLRSAQIQQRCATHCLRTSTTQRSCSGTLSRRTQRSRPAKKHCRPVNRPKQYSPRNGIRGRQGLSPSLLLVLLGVIGDPTSYGVRSAPRLATSLTAERITAPYKGYCSGEKYFFLFNQKT